MGISVFFLLLFSTGSSEQVVMSLVLALFFYKSFDMLVDDSDKSVKLFSYIWFFAVFAISTNMISWASAGALGFKGSKKSTPFAAGLSSENAGKKAYDLGMRKVEVFVKGLGPGRETAIRSLQTAGLEITAIDDVTPIPHNGCRPPKRPRG